MKDFLNLILNPFKGVYFKFKKFAPNLLAMITIIFLGIIVAIIIKKIVRRFLKAVKFDNWSERMGITAMMRKADLWAKPSDAIGTIVFWLVLIVVMMVGLSTLKLDAIDNLVSQVALYLPRVFSVLLILVFGYIIAAFVSRTVLITAVNSGYHYAKLLAEIVRLLLTVLILAMALEQLNVAPGIVIAAFSIIFGGIVLALSISFGVGGIESAKKLLEKDHEKEEKKKIKDIEHI